MLLLNAVSVNMVPVQGATLRIRPINLDEAKEIVSIGFTSAIGHADTANVVGGMLGVPIPANRVSVQLGFGDEALVAQYLGPRLPEGATSLPEGATIRFFHLMVGEL